MHKTTTSIQAGSSPGVASYEKTTLSNGIRIVTEQIPYVRSISAGVWVDVGSRDESEKNNGLSHFVEHMVFKGTRRYKMNQIAHSLESVGGYLNAFTTKEHTCFYARILDEFLPKAIDVISDLVRFPRFLAADIEKEKQVVLEEIRNIEDDADDLIHDYFDKSLYTKHPLGFPIIGNAANVTRFSRADLVGHMERFYAPSRLVVAAAGNVRHGEVVALIEKYLGSMKSPGDIPAAPFRAQIPRSMRQRSEIVEKPITQSHICMGTIGYSVKSKQRYPLLILNTLLGEGMSSRLFQNIREKYGFAYNVYSFANFMSDTGTFGVYIGTDKNNIDNSIGLIHKELGKLRRTPVTKVELRRAKAQLKGSLMLSLENTSNRMTRLGSGELYYRECIPIDEVISRIDAVTIDDVTETAQKILRSDLFSTIIFKPSAADRVPASKLVA